MSNRRDTTTAIENPRTLDQDVTGEHIVQPRRAEEAAGKLAIDCPSASRQAPVRFVLEASPDATGEDWRHVMEIRVTGQGAAALARPKFATELPLWAQRYRYRIIATSTQRVRVSEL